MPACHIEPSDKKKFIGAVGEALVQAHGKKKYYRPTEVRRAAELRGYPVDIHCWAYCVFTTPEDFKAIHDAAGEVCDYADGNGKRGTENGTGPIDLHGTGPIDLQKNWTCPVCLDPVCLDPRLFGPLCWLLVGSALHLRPNSGLHNQTLQWPRDR